MRFGQWLEEQEESDRDTTYGHSLLYHQVPLLLTNAAQPEAGVRMLALSRVADDITNFVRAHDVLLPSVIWVV